MKDQRISPHEGQLRRFRWNAAGNLVATERKNDANQWSTFQTFAYDSADRRLKSTDALGRTTTSAYDLLGRLTALTDAAAPTGNVTSFAYDPMGQRTRVVDAKGHVTRFAYATSGGCR